MPAMLRENQYEISDIDGSGALVFGTEDTGYLTLTRPTHSRGEPRTADTPRTQEPGDAFGTDYQGSKSTSFVIGVLTDRNNSALAVLDPHITNLDFLDRIQSKWEDPRFTSDPTRIAMLRACEATGRVSRAYGRPRRYDEAAGGLTRQGYTPVVCDFLVSDGCWYDDAEQFVDATLRPSVDGGIVFPIVFPLTTIAESESGERIAQIGGLRATWPVIEFHGPCTDPSVEIGDLRIGLRGTIAYDRVVTFDPRPWVRAVTWDGGGSASDLLTTETPTMRRSVLDPGAYLVRYRGQDVTGTSFVRVRWRNARSRP